MFLPDLVLRSRQVVTPGGLRPASVHVRGGRIIGVLDLDEVPDGCEVDDAGDATVMPGLVDLDVRAGSDPDTIALVSRSAAAGGVISIVGRPNASIGAIQVADQTTPDLIQHLAEHHQRTHIVSVSSADVLNPLYQARVRRAPITAGTCPHYLHFVAEDLASRRRTINAAPPIGRRTDREFLWAALANGLLQTIATAHSPGPDGVWASLRARVAPPPGVASIQLGLSIVWTTACARGYSLAQVADWMCRAPATLAGLTKKGRIEVGFDADLVVFDRDTEFTVDRRTLERDHAATPYHGERLRGMVERTYAGGRLVYTR